MGESNIFSYFSDCLCLWTVFFVRHLFLNTKVFKRYFLFSFRQRGREGEREEKKYQCVVASCTPHNGEPDPTTQACALTGNQTGNPLVCRLVLNPLSHTSQGHKQLFLPTPLQDTGGSTYIGRLRRSLLKVKQGAAKRRAPRRDL